MKKRRITHFLAEDIPIGILGVIVICLIQTGLRSYGISFWDKIANFTLDESLCVDVIITQYTITFLIVSLLSLLSGSGEYVYWIDILEEKIISPRLLNFISLSVYGFISMFAGTIAFMRHELELVMIFFMIDVILLVFLTFRMTSIYFGKDRIRRRAHRHMVKEIMAYLNNPNPETLNDIEDKLNKSFENASKLAEDKQYSEVIDTDFQMLIDLSELMVEKYDNDLAKTLFGNMAKIIMLFTDNSEYVFSRFNDLYSPFTNNTLKKHTIEMIQSALGNYYEKLLAEGNYQISQDYWIKGIYKHLNESYIAFKKASESTALVTDSNYHNYEGEILFHNLSEKSLPDFRLIDLKLELTHDKLLRFSQLIYKNNPNLFFRIINEYSMAFDVMQEMNVLQLACENAVLLEANKACKTMVDKLYLFELNEIIDTYYDYDMTQMISKAMGNFDYEMQLKTKICDNGYDLSSSFKKMVYDSAYKYKSCDITYSLLCQILGNLDYFCNLYHLGHMREMQGKKVKYPLVFQTYVQEVIFNAKINDPEFASLLRDIKKEYAEDVNLSQLIDRLLILFATNTNIVNYMAENSMYKQSNRNVCDVRGEWIWGIDLPGRKKAEEEFAD